MFMKSEWNCPAPNCPISAQAFSTRAWVLPPPEENRSRLSSVLSSPARVGTNALNASAVCRIEKIDSPSGPQPGSPGQRTGILDGRSVALKLGSSRPKSWMKSRWTFPDSSIRAVSEPVAPFSAAVSGANTGGATVDCAMAGPQATTARLNAMRTLAEFIVVTCSRARRPLRRTTSD